MSIGPWGIEMVPPEAWTGAGLRIVDIESDGKNEILLSREGDDAEPGSLRIIRP